MRVASNLFVFWFGIVSACLFTGVPSSLLARPVYERTMPGSWSADTLSNSAGQDSLAAKVLLPGPVSNPFPRKRPKLYYINLPAEKVQVHRDSTGRYQALRTIYGYPAGLPNVMSMQDYARLSREHSLRDNWRSLIEEGKRRQESERGLLDFKINVPGGRQSAFTTIFGKPEVNLKVNGTANMNLGASIQKTADPSLPPNQQTRVDPTFEQNLKLNIQGNIGDKLHIRTDWDTERSFDFQNRLNIVYEGYEDEIIKKIEMGNVSMETGNSLIRGGGALFGIKSIAEMGPLRLTSVVSQQEGQGNTQTITGGAKEEQFSIRPADYEDDKHFFIDFFTRQQFEDNMSNPQQLGTALDISEINVWMLNASSQAIEGQRQAIALVDLGVVQNGGQYAPPDEKQDRFTDEAKLDSLRSAQGVSASDFGVDPSSFAEGQFVPLVEGVDYEINRPLGYITLKRTLDTKQALAISFSYRDPQTGETHYVGDINQGGQDRIYLKLLRPQNMTTDNEAWPLTMRNIYSLNATDLKRDGLNVDVQFYPIGSNVPQNTLPGSNTYLLEALGLDRVDVQGGVGADNNIDFSTGTLDAANGRIIFPYLQPFGDRIRQLLTQAGADQATIDNYTFDDLYNQKKRVAAQESQNSYFRVDGKAKGAVSDNYYLGLALVEGSVHVYSNGVELTEGSDYDVDYSIGSITILNKKYLQAGQEIKIEYESNQLMQIEQKTFTGVRAEYNISDDIQLGSTFFKLKERPLQDKIRIGDEPINNAVIGFDAKAKFDTPWLTRAIDKLPLLQTKEPSNLSFSGEFAQLRPGVAQTNAVSEAIKRNRLFKDEEKGVSFVDDFEGVETNISFMSPARWYLASAPAAVPGYDSDAPYFGDNPPTQPNATLDAKTARSDLRGQFAWYSIPLNLSGLAGSWETTPESRRVRKTDVFPGKKDFTTQDEYLTTLDLYYNPTERGPYNYNANLKQLTEDEPNRMWGGMTAVLPSGLEDLTQNNVEFIEFWVQSILPDGREPTPQDLLDYDGKIYIDVGIISEDVVPNYQINSEDGLANIKDNLVVDQVKRSYTPSTTTEMDGQFSNATRELEDVGLDGAPDQGGIDNKNEQTLFSDFLGEMRQSYGPQSEKYKEIAQDPSNDDYVYFGQDKVAEKPLQERFYRMYGHQEGNTPANQGDKRASTNRPDTEGLVTASIVEKNDSYFEYSVDWNPADVENLRIGAPGTYIVDKVVNGPKQEQKWYQVRIPLKDFIRKIGNIENFQNISYIRIWLSGYKKPFTLRFASLEMVGSQWRKAENVNNQTPSNADFKVSSINIEENGTRQPIPYRQPNGAIRAVNRGQAQQTIANEQSIVLETSDLGPQELRMVKKVYPGGLNLINYQHMRMFVHGEGFDKRGDMELVMRFGTDLVNNYYEYRQPVTPTDSTYAFTSGIPQNDAVAEEEAHEVWLTEENGMNLILSRFNQLKQLRDQSGADPNQVFERSDILQEAPPGASIAIKGNPSLDRVTEIGMGLKNPYEASNATAGQTSQVPFVKGQLWLNELRVSGFDNKKGWAANAKAKMQLADFATVNANLSRQTDGFGSLDSRLGQRRMSEELSYDLNTTVNLHKFIPNRYGWNFPVSLSARRSTVTPRFLPNQGDVRLSDFKDAVNARTDISDDQKQQLIDQKIYESETYSDSYTINISNISKQYSKSKLAQYTLDKTTLSYVYNISNKHNPENAYIDNWNYNAGINYNVSFPSVKLFRPFGFLEDVPLLDAMSGLRLGYTPSNVSASATVSRQYNEQQRRTLEGQDPLPVQQTHNFNYTTRFGLGYNLTPSINTNIQTQTSFDLSRAGVVQVDSTFYRVKPTFQVFKEVLGDSLKPRRSNYQENYSASWRPQLRNINLLSWMSYSASYNGGFDWANSPYGSNQGATIGNKFGLNQSLKVDVNNILGRMGWYEALVRADEQETRDRQRSRRVQNGNDGEKESRSLIDHLAYYGRKLVLAGFSMQSFDISYSDNIQSRQSGYAGDAPIYYMFNKAGSDSYSPSLAYRLGLTDRIGSGELIDRGPDSNIRLPSSRTKSNNLTVNTRLTPFTNFSIDLSWATKWDVASSRQDLDAVLSQSGNINSSVWAFGKGYESFFHRQLQTAFNDIENSTDISDENGNNDGRTVLNKVTLQEDFRKAYLGGGTGAVGKRNFTPFPLPSWKITWTGWERWLPFIGSAVSRASLTHSYTGSYRLNWNYNADTGALPPNNLGVYRVTNIRREFEPSSINIEKKFSPLLGINLTWRSNLRTQVSYEYSKLTSLALSNTTVTERLSRGLKFSLGYTIRGFTLPFFKRIKNAVDFTVNTSFLEDTEQKFVLSSDIENALQLGPNDLVKDVAQYDFNPRPPTGQSRVKASAIIGYQFSQTIKANFEYNFNKLMPKSSGVFARTDHDIKFNIIVSIRSS